MAVEGDMIGVQTKALSDVSFAGITLNAIDGAGCSWVLTDITGWWNLPPLDLPDDVRPYQYDGSYTTDGRFKSREIVISGFVEPPATNRGAIEVARNRLLSAIALVRSSGTLQVNETAASKVASIRISDQPQIDISTINNRMSFQLTFRATDPRKYSATQSAFSTPLPTAGVGRTYNRVHPVTYGALGSTGFITATNAGDYSTGAVISFLGPVTNPAVEHIESGARLAFNITLTSVDTLTIDLMSHTVRLNTTASRRSSMSFNSRWFLLQPGINTLRFTGTQGVVDPRTAMTVTYQSAWIE